MGLSSPPIQQLLARSSPGQHDPGLAPGGKIESDPIWRGRFLTSAAPKTPMTIATASSRPARPSQGRHPYLDKEGSKIRSLFDEIAPRYDSLNRLFSGFIDLWWRKKAVQSLRSRSGDRVLDACCGTGDLSFALLDQVPDAEVIGSDFSIEMLRLAKQRSRTGGRPGLVHADTLHLPFGNQSFDGAMVGFGIRNVGDLDAALKELHRVLKPGGRLMILEFTAVRSAGLRPLIDLYQSKILPHLGNLLSGSKARAYSYLDESVRDWPGAERLADRIRAVPFHAVKWRTLMPGNVAVHEAIRA